MAMLWIIIIAWTSSVLKRPSCRCYLQSSRVLLIWCKTLDLQLPSGMTTEVWAWSITNGAPTYLIPLHDGTQPVIRAMVLQYISHPNIQVAHVQCFILMSSFLCSVNCLPQAWILIGQAVRAGQDLGLHVRDLPQLRSRN